MKELKFERSGPVVLTIRSTDGRECTLSGSNLRVLYEDEPVTTVGIDWGIDLVDYEELEARVYGRVDHYWESPGWEPIAKAIKAMQAALQGAGRWEPWHALACPQPTPECPRTIGGPRRGHRGQPMPLRRPRSRRQSFARQHLHPQTT